MVEGSLALPAIQAPDAASQQAVRARLARLTKPPGSLGRLEELVEWLAGVQATSEPHVDSPLVYVIAGDHGVSESGVSAYPREVTAQMVANFLEGGAAINVIAKEAGAAVRVVDAGIATDLGERAGLTRVRIGPGTRNFLDEPAMTDLQARACVETGMRLFNEGRRPDVIALGEMGIGNTTSASAITAAVLQRDALDVTGLGTGIDESARRRKAGLIEAALSLHAPQPGRPLDVLAKVGGFEIGVLAGLMIGAAAQRVPVVLDGFICGAAAVLAVGLAGGVHAYLLAAHQSAEPGHRHVLEHLRLRPVLDLGMRLGEGTGAALALPILRSSARLLSGMATFDDAGVSESPADGG